MYTIRIKLLKMKAKKLSTQILIGKTIDVLVVLQEGQFVKFEFVFMSFTTDNILSL